MRKATLQAFGSAGGSTKEAAADGSESRSITSDSGIESTGLSDSNDKSSVKISTGGSGIGTTVTVLFWPWSLPEMVTKKNLDLPAVPELEPPQYCPKDYLKKNAFTIGLSGTGSAGSTDWLKQESVEFCSKTGGSDSGIPPVEMLPPSTRPSPVTRSTFAFSVVVASSWYG